MYESGRLSGDEEKETEREEEIVLSYDERLDWLESDDCSKWPGRWLHLCFPFSPSLLLSSHTHLLSHSRTSFPPCRSLSPPLPLPSWFHHGSPSTERLSLSPLMAQLLALMHFKRTAAATSQSDGKYMSFSSLHDLCSSFCAISSSFQRVACRDNPPSAKRQGSSSAAISDSSTGWW